MKAICVIPARLESTRLSRKLLRPLNGKLLIQYAYENAKRAKKPVKVLVACDHEELMKAVQSFGGEAVLTSAYHQSGTERIAEVAENHKANVFVNLQADEPLLHSSEIDDLISAFEVEPNLLMATACIRMRDEQDFHNPNVVKVVKNQKDEALYFSRAPIPYDREKSPTDFFKHLGIYAYARDFLIKIPKLAPSILEKREKLEQLRVLDHGFTIKVLETAYDSIGVDTEEDLKKVEKILKTDSHLKESHA